MTFGVLTLLANVFLYNGCEQERRGLFLPWLILEALNIVATIIIAIVYLDSVDEIAGQMQVDSGVVIAGGVIGLLFMGNHYKVPKRCWNYLKNIE